MNTKAGQMTLHRAPLFGQKSTPEKIFQEVSFIFPKSDIERAWRCTCPGRSHLHRLKCASAKQVRLCFHHVALNVAIPSVIFETRHQTGNQTRCSNYGTSLSSSSPHNVLSLFYSGAYSETFTKQFRPAQGVNSLFRLAVHPAKCSSRDEIILLITGIWDVCVQAR